MADVPAARDDAAVVAERRRLLAARLDPAAVDPPGGRFAFALADPRGDAFSVRVVDGVASLEDGLDAGADVRVAIDADGFDALVAGDIDAQLSHRTGRLVVEGDMALAQRVRALLGF